jgi:hypothetical protein
MLFQKREFFYKNYKNSILYFSTFIFLILPFFGISFFPHIASAATEISSWEDLHNMRNDLTGDYILTTNLDADSPGYATYAGNTANGNVGWIPVGISGTPFTGSFNGGGYEIADLFINTTEGNVGLFGEVSSASISDISLSNVDITTSGQYTGGLVGSIYEGSIVRASVTGQVSGNQVVGGLVGAAYTSFISNTHTDVEVNASAWEVGGLIGYNAAYVYSSYALGPVSGDNKIGGLIGFNGSEGEVEDSYAQGDVEGGTVVGGFIGFNNFGEISNSYSTGLVSGVSQVGAFIGTNDGEEVYNSLWDTTVNGVTPGVGGGDLVVEEILGKTTIELQTAETFIFEGWDFDDVWDIELESYPYLLSRAIFDGGTGTIEDPYEISTCEMIRDIDYFTSNNFELVNDIDCDGVYLTQTGSEYNHFMGNFDGNHYTISNMVIESGGDNYVGMFAVIGVGASVENMALENILIAGNQYVGALAGGLIGTVTSVHVNGGEVSGEYNFVGGLVGIHSTTAGIDNSSPLVYTWNGEEYEYVADVGEMATRKTDGVDWAFIDSENIAPKDNVYSINVSQEYNEIVYYDEIALATFDHQPGYTVVEPMLRKISESDLHTVSDSPTHPLVSCTDMYENNCFDDLKEFDDKWSYESEDTYNEWILNFGDLSEAENITLLMRAARDYTEKSDEKIKSVEVRGENGEWLEVYGHKELGSDGTPRLRSLDLTGKFPTNNYDVRIRMNLTNINYVGIDTSAQVPFTKTIHHPNKADLSFRGYTAMDRTYFTDHDYYTVSKTPGEIFAPQTGNFTKYGEVSPLLQDANNQFVIIHHGDHMELEFPYEAPLEGLERSFMLYNNMVYKHADLGEIGRNVEPLPFQGMTEYPYQAPEEYPMTPENIEYLNTWNTRIISGETSGSTIYDSSTNVSVFGLSSVGGLVGANDKEIYRSFALGDVEGADMVGGLVGDNQPNGQIYDSYARNKVVGGSSNTGGFVGRNGGSIYRSYSTSNEEGVTGYLYTGGFAGSNEGYIYSSFSAVDTIIDLSETDAFGGFVGYNVSGATLKNSAWVVVDGHNVVHIENTDCAEFSFYVELFSQCEGQYESLDVDLASSLKSPIQSELAPYKTYTELDGWDFSSEGIWTIDPDNEGVNDGWPLLVWQGEEFAEEDDGFELTDDLVGYWKLQENTGETRSDSFADNDLTDANANVVGVSDGFIGQAAEFTEVDEYLIHADNAELSTGGDTSFSLSLWVRMNEIDGTQVFVSKFDDVSTGEYAVYAENGQFRFSTYTGGIGHYVDALTAEVGEWYHLVAVHNAELGTNMLAVNVSPTNTISEVPQHQDSAGDFIIGAFGPARQYVAKSEIDEVGFWKRVLTNQDINELYNDGQGLTYSDFADEEVVEEEEEEEPSRRRGSSVQSRVKNLNKQEKTNEAEDLMNKFPQVFDSSTSNSTNLTNLSIRDLQKFLNTHGFPVSQTGPGSFNNETDIFGELTRQALIRFQQANGITPALGYFGPITKAFIANMISNNQDTPAQDLGPVIGPLGFDRDLEIGSTGEDVKRLQDFLIAQDIGLQAKALASNGSTQYFGQLTKAALVEWQQVKGIVPASGYFGPKTRAYVLSVL